METTMFTLGVLSMILAALVALVVYGTVMVLKLKRGINDVYRQLYDENQHTYRKFEDMQRDVNMIEATMNNQIQYASTQSNSYTDKRIDKLVDTYFMVKEAEQNTKKIIKG